MTTTAAGSTEVAAAEASLLVTSAGDAEAARGALAAATRIRVAAGRPVPIIHLGGDGDGLTRAAAWDAGADEIIIPPSYLRDLVTVGHLMLAGPEQPAHWVGQLAETVGVYFLIRALASLGRSGVLTMSRGLRRGEVRYYLGEVTSAQIGGLHGQAALHQLLLWTDGRYDFRREDVVRRRQIPLPPEELFADAERFLHGIRDASGELSPAMVFEQDATTFAAQATNQTQAQPHSGHGLVRYVLQCAIPVAATHICSAHFHPVAARVLHQLRRGVKAHGLRIDECGQEAGGFMALEPCADVRQQGKTVGMALRKTVITKAQDLLKDPLCKT